MQSSGIFSKAWVRNNSGIVSFIACTLVAACIWTINALNKIQHSTCDITLKYDNSWLKTWGTENPPLNVKLELSGRGFDLMSFYFHLSSSVVEINQQALFTNNNQVRTVDLIQPVLSKLNNKIHIDKITPELFPLPGLKPFVKKVALKPKYEISLDANYMISGIPVCVPDSILISSLTKFPDTLTSINTNLIARSGVNKPVFTSVEADFSLLPNVVSESKKIWMYIPVEQATECVLKIPLSVNANNGKNIQLVPSEIELSCRVPLSRYDQTIPGKFKVAANIISIKQKKAVIAVLSAPVWADRIKINPPTVDFFYRQP